MPVVPTGQRGHSSTLSVTSLVVLALRDGGKTRSRRVLHMHNYTLVAVNTCSRLHVSQVSSGTEIAFLPLAEGAQGGGGYI
jgi:hypothetical protein